MMGSEWWQILWTCTVFFWRLTLHLQKICSFQHLLSDLFVVYFTICYIPTVMYQNALFFTWIAILGLLGQTLIITFGKYNEERQKRKTLNSLSMSVSVSGQVSLELCVCMWKREFTREFVSDTKCNCLKVWLNMISLFYLFLPCCLSINNICKVMTLKVWSKGWYFLLKK